ncbi:hypothetical protein E4T56_gene3672 [Termitomyces sp. T112]|nr:hypothetical protein E4T56_gene3672 [Termitomyces sp. T112]
MSSNRRTSSAVANGASRTETPERSHLLPMHSDLKLLMSIDTSPVRNLQEARKWLEMKGWILTVDPYDQARMTSILITAVLTSTPTELKAMAIAVAFILEANIMDHVSDSLVDTVISKTADWLDNMVGRLNTSIDFLAASNTSWAEAMLSLGKTSEALKGLATTLEAATSAIMNISTHPMQAKASEQPRTWASVVSSGPALSPLPPPHSQCASLSAGPNGSAALSHNKHMRIQQKIFQNLCMVLVSVDCNDDNAPKDLSPKGTARLQELLNGALTKLNAKSSPQGNAEDGKVPVWTPATWAPKAPEKLRIWQQNVCKLDVAQATMLDTASPNDWDMLAIQEPFLEPSQRQEHEVLLGDTNKH